MTAAKLISISQAEDNIAFAPFTIDLASELSAESDDCAEPAQGDWEYWGSDDDGDWRVRLTRTRPEPEIDD